MRTLLFFSFFLWIPLPTFTQTIETLEANLNNQVGEAYINDALKLTDHFYSLGNYDKASLYAGLATTKAQETSLPNLMAIALNKEAKILLRLPGKVDKNRTEAIKKLTQSSQYTQDVKLKLENLEIARNIAIMRNQKKQQRDIELEIATLKGNFADVAIAEKEVIEKEKEALSKDLTAIQREKLSLSASKANLEQTLQAKESMLEEMTLAQIKSQVLLLEKQRLLDSLSFTKLFDSLSIANQQIENQELESQLSLQKSQRNLLISAIGVILLLAFGLYSRYTNIKQYNAVLEEKNRIIQAERERSEDLLLNILPKVVADQLKLTGKAPVERFEAVTVMFSDFINFSRISAQISPEQLIEMLDYCFQAFDQIIEKHKLEKIKTIGDAYLCAGGLNTSNSINQAHEVICAALEMQDFLQDWKMERIKKELPYFEARLGIHTGPIVAGVVGKKKFVYDIWGDTVNVASRMETSSEAGKVNVSAATYELVKNNFDWEHRGKIQAKNLGEIDMYYVVE